MLEDWISYKLQYYCPTGKRLSGCQAKWWKAQFDSREFETVIDQ